MGKIKHGKRMQPNRITFIDTRELPSYEEYEMWCEDMGKKPKKETTEHFRNWQSREQAMRIDDFFSNLSFSKIDNPLVITGELGLWDGTHDINPVVARSVNLITETYKDGSIHTRYENPSIKVAIERCLGSDTLDFKVVWENKGIHVYAWHHDGCNHFEIHKLNINGYRALDAADRRLQEPEPQPWWYGKILYDDVKDM